VAGRKMGFGSKGVKQADTSKAEAGRVNHFALFNG
jgi:hypothetical protein